MNANLLTHVWSPAFRRLRSGAERRGVRQPAAAFPSQPAGAESFDVAVQSDGVRAKRLASREHPSDSPPAGWLAESGSRLPHSSALRAPIKNIQRL